MCGAGLTIQEMGMETDIGSHNNHPPDKSPDVNSRGLRPFRRPPSSKPARHEGDWQYVNIPFPKIRGMAVPALPSRPRPDHSAGPIWPARSSWPNKLGRIHSRASFEIGGVETNAQRSELAVVVETLCGSLAVAVGQ